MIAAMTPQTHHTLRCIGHTRNLMSGPTMPTEQFFAFSSPDCTVSLSAISACFTSASSSHESNSVKCFSRYVFADCERAPIVCALYS